MKNIHKLIISIALCEGAGIIGALFTVSAIPTWYAHLHKPPFSPPNWIFGPVWTTLYLLMGISLYLVWKKGLKKDKIRFAFIFFLAHLAINAIWSVIFFGFQNIALAFLDILILLGMIVYLIKIFYPINKASAWLLAPYLLWVSFATILNLSLLILN